MSVHGSANEEPRDEISRLRWQSAAEYSEMLARVIPTPLALALVACTLLISAVVAPAQAKPKPKPTIAVSYFENNTGDDQYSALGRGLADMLITDISSIAGAQIVERARLNLLLQELELSKSPFIDPATAAKMGRGLGAHYIVTGSFVSVEPMMRMDARVVEVASGKVIYSTDVQGPISEFFLLEKELALTLTEAIGIKLTARENARLGRVATDSFEAFNAWSKGLEAFDRGEIEVARRALDKALERDSGFGPAAKLLGELKTTTSDLSSRRHAMLVSDAASVIKALKSLKEKKGSPKQVLNIIDFGSIESSMPNAAREAKEIARVVMDLKVPDSVQFGPVGYRISVNNWAMRTYFMASHHLHDRADLIGYGQAYMKRYPRGTYFRAVESLVNNAVTELKKARAGRQTVPAIREAASIRRLELLCGRRRDLDQKVRDCAAFVKRIAASKTAKKQAERLEEGIEDLIGAVKKTPTASSLALAQKTIRKVSKERDVLQELVSLSTFAERQQQDADHAPAAIQRITCGRHPQRAFRLVACRERAKLSRTLGEKDLASAIKAVVLEASKKGYTVAEMQSSADFLSTLAVGLRPETRVKGRIDGLRSRASRKTRGGATKRPPKNISEARRGAESLSTDGRPQEAKRFALSALRSYPNDARLKEVLVRIALEQGDLRTAQSIADSFASARASAGQPEDTQLARVVESHRSRLASHSKSLARGYSDAADAYFEAGRRKEAQKLLNTALGKFPSSKALNRTAVDHAEAKGDRAEASKAMTRWKRSAGANAITTRVIENIERIPSYVETRHVESQVQDERAYALKRADQWQEAADLFLHIAREFPNGHHPELESLEQAAQLYRMAGKIRKSRTLYKEIIKRFDGNHKAEYATSMLTLLPK